MWTAEVLAAAATAGVLPLDYMLTVMRDPAADDKRRDAMAMAAAPYLHSKLTAVDAKLSPVAAEPGRGMSPITVTFVMPERDDDD